MSRIFTSEEIRERFFLGEGHYEGLDTLTNSVNVVERLLGRAWIDRYYYAGGLLPLRVLARLGELLLIAERVPRFRQSILSRIRRTFSGSTAVRLELTSAWSELRVIEPFLQAGCVAEFAPIIVVDERTRRPDFAVGREGERVIVEVTCPSASAKDPSRNNIYSWW